MPRLRLLMTHEAPILPAIYVLETDEVEPLLMVSQCAGAISCLMQEMKEKRCASIYESTRTHIKVRKVNIRQKMMKMAHKGLRRLDAAKMLMLMRQWMKLVLKTHLLQG